MPTLDVKAIVSRVLTAGVGLACAKLAALTGVVVDPATQGSIVVGVYASLHKVVEHLLKRR